MLNSFTLLMSYSMTQKTTSVEQTVSSKNYADLVFVCYQFAATYNLDLDEALSSRLRIKYE